MSINEPLFDAAMSNNITKDRVEELRQAMSKKEKGMNLTAHLCNVFYVDATKVVYYRQNTWVNVSGTIEELFEAAHKVFDIVGTKDSRKVWVYDKTRKPKKVKVQQFRHHQAIVITGFSNGQMLVITKVDHTWGTVELADNKKEKK